MIFFNISVMSLQKYLSQHFLKKMHSKLHNSKIDRSERKFYAVKVLVSWMFKVIITIS